jgi:hypothetical protein
MTTVDINDFTIEKECTFEGERYSVRNNGSVLRHARPEKRTRATDDTWTFGKPNSANAYLHISDARVHRIVATAFHGEPPDPKYVVDHIDSNCRNNRPENLRWLTRLENTLNNPVTRKKIEYLCGSIEAFLENPSMLNNMNLEPNISWMRTVTPEEALNCKMRMSIWANSKNKPTRSAIGRRSSFGDNIYKPLQKWELGHEPGLSPAMTPGCGQYMWRASSYFPCCPQEMSSNPLESYFQNLKVGTIFSYSDHAEFCPILTIRKFEKNKDGSSILIICEKEGTEAFAVSGVSICEKGFFIHFNLGSYLDEERANAAFLVKQELTDFWSEAYKHQTD